jgi:F0F1-type ATP synthase beta subunit
MNTEKIVKVLGPVVDVEFPDKLPGIYNALPCEYTVQDVPAKLTLEVQRCGSTLETNGCGPFLC